MLRALRLFDDEDHQQDFISQAETARYKEAAYAHY